MRSWNDHLLPKLRKISPIPIMADERRFDHHDAIRLIDAGACTYVNIKLLSQAAYEAMRINDVCAERNTACMMGGMLESRGPFQPSRILLRRKKILYSMIWTPASWVTLKIRKDGVKFSGIFLSCPNCPASAPTWMMLSLKIARRL
jgi:hypothetical protein